MKNWMKDLFQYCRPEELKELLVCLVKARSYPGVPRQEEGVAKELQAYLKAHGIESEFVSVREGRPNLLASLSAAKAGPHLLFCGHTDTVPPNVQDQTDMFSAVEKDGYLYGRGTVDMKGAVAAMAVALVCLHKAKALTSGKVTLAAVVDEEMESLGAEALILGGFTANGAIIGEPTSNLIAIGHKGLEWLQVDFEGRAAHGGTPEAGINAIFAAAHFAHLVETDLAPSLKKRQDRILGNPVINIGTISGGDQPSTVAAHCQIKLDRRWVTTETIEQVFEDLEALLNKVKSARPGLKTKISRVPGGMATMLHGPTTIDDKSDLVQAAKKALADLKLSEKLTVFPAWTDAALISREAGIPSIIWGPGDLACAHSPGERIKLDEVLDAAKLYALAALYFTRS